MSRLTTHLARGVSRRSFLRTGSLAVAAAAIPVHAASATGLTTPSDLDPLGSPFGSEDDQKGLTEAAISAAKAAGASYTDVQIRWRQQEDWVYFMGKAYPTPSRNDTIGFGVRSLVNGYWGFAAADGEISTDVAAQLGRDSVAQAKIAATGKERVAELAPTPVVTGSWRMPVEIDPFMVSLEEKADYCMAISDHISRDRYGVGTTTFLFLFKEDRTFGSSEGSFVTQTVYRTSGTLSLGVPRDWLTEIPGGAEFELYTPAGRGWEYIRNSKDIKDRTSMLVDRALGARRPKPVDVGRYDVVFDASAIAGILGQTVGIATELDRAMGNEANGVGTSYLNDPNAMIGTFKIGSPLLNVTANRSMPGGAATVKWDDEGVAPADFALVKDGILADFQTTREAASWLAPTYKKAGKPVQSNGCAGAYSATLPMQQFDANLVMRPGAQELSFDDLVKSTKKGYAVLGGYTYADQQALNGSAGGDFVYEIVDGKLGRTVSNAQIIYRSPEFWKNLVALGGSKTAATFGFNRYRDEYSHQSAHSVSAVPVKVTGVAMTDVTRKA
jgi:TldD protein